MFGIGGGEFIVIALLALIVVGPEQLPGLMRKAGHTASQLRSMSSSLRSEFMNGIDQADLTKWGKGTTDDPVVPRGFSKQSGSSAPASISDAAPDTQAVDPAPSTTSPTTSTSTPPTISLSTPPITSDPDEVTS